MRSPKLFYKVFTDKTMPAEASGSLLGPLRQHDSSNPRVPMRKLRVKGLGPIYEAEVELKPLTVFAGASNTGKSYLSTLIYAIHSAGETFSRLACESFMSGANWEDPRKSDLRDLRVVTKWMKEALASSMSDAGDHSVEIPKAITEIFKRKINESSAISESLNQEMPRFIDSSNYHTEKRSGAAGFSIYGPSGSEKKLLEVKYVASRKKYEPRLNVTDMSLTKSSRKTANRIIKQLERYFEILNTESSKHAGALKNGILPEIKFLFQALIGICHSSVFGNILAKAKFLPASRSSLMVNKHVFSMVNLGELTKNLQSLTSNMKNQPSILDPVSAEYLASVENPRRDFGDSRDLEELSKKIER